MRHETGEADAALLYIDIFPAEPFAAWRGRPCRCRETWLAKQSRKSFVRMRKALAAA